MIPLTCAIPERIRGGLRRCAIQIDVYFTYFTLLYFNPCAGQDEGNFMLDKSIQC